MIQADLQTNGTYAAILFKSMSTSVLIHSSAFSLYTYCRDMTPHALIKLSVYPANNVCPSALHAKLTHSGSLLFLPTAVYSGFNSSTLLFFSRSKMMIELDVAAHSQYRLGEKTRAWISSPAVREYRCLDSLRSQSMVVPSLPPEAQREPSGDMVTVLM